MDSLEVKRHKEEHPKKSRREEELRQKRPTTNSIHKDAQR